MVDLPSMSLIILPFLVNLGVGQTVNITPECQKYCDSKRPYGTTEEFIADCGLKISYGPRKCAGACKDNNCPDHLCPKQFDVNCPTGISLKPPPSTIRMTAGWRSPKLIGILAAVFSVILITCCIISCIIKYRTTRRRRVYLAQREDYENEASPVFVQVSSVQSSDGF